MSKLLIAIAGLARSGKNTLANLIERELDPNLKIKQFSFAKVLKENLNKITFSKDFETNFLSDECKDIKRPLMIEYGNFMRKVSKGEFWWKELKLQVDQFFDSSGDVSIITDFRFFEFENDEYHFIKNYDKENVKSIIVAMDREGISAAHVSESINFDKIKKFSDFNVNVKSLKNLSELKNNPDINNLLFELKKL